MSACFVGHPAYRKKPEHQTWRRLGLSPPQRNVAILIDAASGPGWNLLTGIARYVQSHGHWIVSTTSEEIQSVLSKAPTYQSDGLIAQLDTPGIATIVEHFDAPAVLVEPGFVGAATEAEPPMLGQIRLDSEAIAYLAVDHLLETGPRSLAFVGTESREFSRECEAAFRALAAREGLECHIYYLNESAQADWEQQNALLADWLKTLAAPVGLMAWSDICGRRVLRAARMARLYVPDDLAVVGVGNDDLLCSLCDPPLSSVDVAAERCGYEAAALLDRLMVGTGDRSERVVMPVTSVIARRSTDTFAFEDPDLTAALRYIRSHAHKPIQVQDVLSDICVSRRTLESRFRKWVGHSIYTEIVRTRVKRARRLLVDTDLGLEDVALLSGFRDSVRMSQVFQRVLNMTPGAVRAEARRRHNTDDNGGVSGRATGSDCTSTVSDTHRKDESRSA